MKKNFLPPPQPNEKNRLIAPRRVLQPASVTSHLLPPASSHAASWAPNSKMNAPAVMPSLQLKVATQSKAAGVPPSIVGGPQIRQNVIQPMIPRQSDRLKAPDYHHNYVSTVVKSHIDKYRREFWNGFRSSMGWYQTTKTHMGRFPKICATCNGPANSIDHKIDFATTQTSLPTTDYCDTFNHFRGILKSVAQDDFNNLRNLQWMCQSCNSHKSGAHGLYTSVMHLGKCPAANGGICTL
ncbi:hypothetical protein [Azospirillum agricola]|uniref:hypothetical protein n=1 Tax=Azospirillum agricola TaxID=1720247 RepID=UPI000A0F36EF|nr:hypothetical protein [Azospirillum agricola]SMH63010.1 hypothetical protein SAMN02982994_6837 [Azospirillum lipoferum]